MINSNYINNLRMKKIIFLPIIFIVLLATSCSKDKIVDYTKSENLSGTKWKSTTVADLDKNIEYVLLTFTSSSTVELWSKYIGEAEQKNWSGSFSISNDRISILYDDNEITGTIVGETMNLNFLFGKYIFSKQ